MSNYDRVKRWREANKKECPDCGKLINPDSTKCRECKDYTKVLNTLSITVGEIRKLYKNKSTMAIAAKIRGYGITLYNRSELPKYCVTCGYNKHYEVCHITAVKDFPDTATMAEVHAIDNLIALCPNCHWEYDHGMLSIEQIKSAA